MKVSGYIAKFLSKQGVSHVFELSGGMITHLLDSIYSEGEVDIVTLHHEQSAAFAADGMARLTRIPAVAMATSGPGATNLLTGIASCYFDSVPAVFITGQVNVYEQKGNRNIRQNGFQETDIVAMAEHITKAAFAVKVAEDVPAIFEEAFRLAVSGRPGPVLIDIPMNVQREELAITENDIVRIYLEPDTKAVTDIRCIQEIYSDILKSKKPLILAGRGVLASGCKDDFINLVDKLKIPVVLSLLALDTLPSNHQLRVGMIGTYGNRWANLSLCECDLLIVIGSRLDVRQTGADTAAFSMNKKIYHIDIDEGEINNRIKNCIPVKSDIRFFLKLAIEFFRNIELSEKEDWMSSIKEGAIKWPDTRELQGIKGINPNEFVRQLSLASGDAAAVLADVGSHQMWVAQSFRFGTQQRFLTSGGMGAMGYALPAAIGAAFALNQPVLSISGDGGFQLNIQELQTIVRNKLPIKLVVINNQSLGMIRQFQDSYFEGKHQSTVWGYSAPDFCKLAVAYGINSYKIESDEEIEFGLKALWEKSNEPFLLEVMVDKRTNVYPKLAFGRPLSEMEPDFNPVDIEST